MDQRLLDHMQRQQEQLRAYAPGMGYLDGASQVQRPRVQPTPQLWTPARGRGATINVAAYNARPYEKEQADLRCDGVDDHEQITAALDMVNENVDDNWTGTVLLSSGQFWLTAPIQMPGYTRLIGTSRDATEIRAQSCNGIEVDTVAEIAHLSLTNDGPTASNTDGIKSLADGNIVWWSGFIHDCWFYQFGTCINLYTGRWLIDRNMFWNYYPDLAFTPWAVKSRNDGTYTNFGRGMFRWNAMSDGHGVYLSGGSNQQWDIFGNDFDVGSQQEGVDGVAVQLDQNGSDLQTRVYDNRLDGEVLINARKNHFRGNQFGNYTVDDDYNTLEANVEPDILINAAADNTRAFANQRASISDLGTNTKLNLDGSANDWNW